MASTSALRQICFRRTAIRHYSENSGLRTTDKWGLQGIPRPRSILEDDDAKIDLSEDNDAVNGMNPNTPPIHLRRPSGKPTPPEYKAHKETLRKEFPQGWSPPRKLSREAMDALRQLNRMDPETFKTPVLADKFKISPEAVRRILRSRWEPPAEKRATLVVKERRIKEERLEARKMKEILETRSSQDAVPLKGAISSMFNHRKDRFSFE